jgi:hypothetical protein
VFIQDRLDPNAMTHAAGKLKRLHAAGFTALMAALVAGSVAAQPAPDAVSPSGQPYDGKMTEHVRIETPAGVLAQPVSPEARVAPPAPPTAPDANRPCCLVPAGTPVAVQLVKPLSTHDVQSGDAFAMRLATPVIVDGQVVAPAGAPVVGRVVQATKPGMGGKAAKLVVSAEYVRLPRGNLPLQGLKLAGNGEDRSGAANAAGIGGIAFMPLAVLGFAIQGGNIEIPAGTAASATIAKAVDLPPLAAATAQDYDAQRALLANTDPTRGWLTIAPPPPGMGQVVFFRPTTAMGTGQWFNVREEGQALGKLTNGVYFVTPLPPGQHSFTASTEPEFKDRLTLKIDPGETYYVEGMLTKGVVIGVANLTPSDKARFDKLSSELQPAQVEQAAAGAPAAPRPH